MQSSKSLKIDVKRLKTLVSSFFFPSSSNCSFILFPTCHERYSCRSTIKNHFGFWIQILYVTEKWKSLQIAELCNLFLPLSIGNAALWFSTGLFFLQKRSFCSFKTLLHSLPSRSLDTVILLTWKILESLIMQQCKCLSLPPSVSNNGS